MGMLGARLASFEPSHQLSSAAKRRLEREDRRRKANDRREKVLALQHNLAAPKR